MTHETLTGSQLSIKAAALRMVDLPLSVYSSLTQVSVSTGTKKLVAATTFGTISLLLLARRFKRRKGRKKSQLLQWDQADFKFVSPAAAESDNTSHNISFSFNSKNSCSTGSGLVLTTRDYRKLSGSLASLASVKSVNSSSSSTCANESIGWDGGRDADVCSVVNLSFTTPENLYLMGMDLFEEALQRWEEALTFRSRQGEDDASCTSVKTGAGDAIAEQSMEDVISVEFIHRLKSLLQRAYRLQEEFEGVLGMSEPSSRSSSQDEVADLLAREDLDDVCLRDSISIASNDSFVSAAELSEHRDLRGTFPLGHHPFYEEALQMAEEGKISCRVLRTEILECVGDLDFLAKLHCVRQACELILSDRVTRMFLADTGRKILSSIIVKAQKSPKRFEEVFEELIFFLEHSDHWEDTELELASRGVRHLNFYDVVLDFILMDSFEDLENPPISIQNVINNRWLNSSFKETAVASSCWSVLKQKRQHMKVANGFISHFYAVCEQISPVLAWGFLGPKTSLHDLCFFFKDQVLHFLKDVFDPDKVRYSSVETLAEDMLHLMHRRSELLLAYLGPDTLRPLSGCSTLQVQLVPSALLEAQAQ
ncbi:mitoguardin 1 [Girardinichthys multiradiatus]|uniref:mitoguardin 1 n=1 Tax=Girardinichthys multiradiatus TaxID=208333 RepID=UPI001FAE09F3|nr:mitoguardin 1 [Girardinichthys multiradiatus]XP_047224939.1 mitoguardin 1 [Girardinichthys multiradiatus]XP_047224941.1 mitoguardin 1 [Girardinichthys multiradiatus]XP_047224942.1 mitoguardin 1 [Girardinichthys multiradiatus]XP_047224943.1 mitoguardin 1 [Girardinichthys multiradiatus]XP_047224944.1 mitoguardin 1 [Girardinichthys multiradiatus]